MIAFPEISAEEPTILARFPGGDSDQRTEMPPRFTLDGDDALEQHLERTCARVLSGLKGLIPPTKLEAVLLGGGYGRGEGGVLRTPAGDRPYNDLEFYVAIAGNRHVNELAYRRRLQVLAEILTHLAGVEVEFKIISLTAFERQPISMFSYDLVVGHRRLGGAPTHQFSTEWEQHRLPENIPLEEATRLLMNRCAGLLFAKAKLARDPFSADSADFIRRNVAKAQLAMGDAVLVAHRRYHWSCRERHQRLECLLRAEPSAWLAKLLRHHSAGVAFKLHPQAEPVSREALAVGLREVTACGLECWLWLETLRCGHPFGSARAYSMDAVDKCPGGSRPRNFLLNFRVDGWRMDFSHRAWQHPRQRIFRALALLLWEPAALREPRLKKRLQRDLGAHVVALDDAVARFEQLWLRVR